MPLYYDDMTTAQKLLTAEEFFALPDPPEGGKMELVRGEVVTSDPAGLEHGVIAGGLGAGLVTFVRQHRIGKVVVGTGYCLERQPDVVLAPDVSFLEASRVPVDIRSFIDGPPTLAVEVNSPGDTADDVLEKVIRYLSAGTSRVWVVSPKNKTVTVHRPDGSARVRKSDETLSSDDAGFGVEGFELNIGELFGQAP